MKTEKIRRIRHWVLAGMAVGMAEAVPGISGGTVALLVGVYERLISALSALSPGRLLQQWRKRNFRPPDMGFLAVFGLSMLLAIWLLSHPLSVIYADFEQAFRAFLLVLLVLSLPPLLLRLRLRRGGTLLGLAAGVVLGAVWTLRWQWQLEPQPLSLLLAGMGAGTLLLLPGVSGSYLLLLLGLYGDVLDAVRQLQWQILLPLALGVMVGVLFCARLLQWLFARTGDAVRALLYGLIIGSLPAIFPSQYSLDVPVLLAVVCGLLAAAGLYWLSQQQRVAPLLLLGVLAGSLTLSEGAFAAAADKTQNEVPKGWLAYRIQKGENLSMIANLYGLKLGDLVRWNKLTKPYRIFPGQELRMPPKTLARLHRVRKSETLSGIALQYRTFISRLRMLNGLSATNILYPGQVLRLAPELQPAVHTVRRGEHLWGLALRYSIEMEELVRINGLKEPLRIFPGQKLLLAGTGRAAAKPQAAVRKARRPTAPPTAKRNPAARSGPKISAPRPSPRARPIGAPTRWVWPADGSLKARFHPAKHKGIEISGAAGARVRAAAEGVVRYAGDGLFRDYGWLIILGHGRYLSVYAHNDSLLVKEGDRVKAGQQIARMGSTGSDRVQLHFQVKFRGRPTDPLTLLPMRKKDTLSGSGGGASR